MRVTASTFGDLLRWGLAESESEQAELYRKLPSDFFSRSKTELLQKTTEDHGGVHLPWSAVRDLQVSVSNEGGHLVGQKAAVTFVDALREHSSVLQLGAQLIGGLVGNADMPTVNGDPVATFVAEGSAAPASNPTFGLVPMRPKTCIGYVDVTRRFVKQSSLPADALLARILAAAAGAALEKAAIYGDGINEPRGILNTPGIGAVAIGPDGGALTWEAVTELEWAAASTNGSVSSPAMLTNRHVRRSARRSLFAGTSVSLWDKMGEMAPAMVTSHAPNDLTKGASGPVCSPLIYSSNWQDLYVGVWGGLEILFDRFTLLKSGGVRVCVFLDCDLAVAHPAAFSAIADITTA